MRTAEAVVTTVHIVADIYVFGRKKCQKKFYVRVFKCFPGLFAEFFSGKHFRLFFIYKRNHCRLKPCIVALRHRYNALVSVDFALVNNTGSAGSDNLSLGYDMFYESGEIYRLFSLMDSRVNSNQNIAFFVVNSNLIERFRKLHSGNILKVPRKHISLLQNNSLSNILPPNIKSANFFVDLMYKIHI